MWPWVRIPTGSPHLQHDGRVTLYQRTDVQKATWHCRIAFPKQPHIRQSLLTTNEKEAERMAEKIYRDLLYRYERGLPLKRVKFEEVTAAYFVHLEDEVNRGITKPERLTTNRIMSRYCLEYFKGRYIDTITSADINKFRDWRRKYWTTGPGSKVEEYTCLLYTSPSPRDRQKSRMPSSA